MRQQSWFYGQEAETYTALFFAVCEHPVNLKRALQRIRKRRQA